MPERLTITDIEQRLIDDNRPISLVSYGGSMNKPSRWECHNCGHKWNTVATSILNNGRGCPSCAGSVPLTPANINQHLIDTNRPISLVSYGGSMNNKSSLWKCRDCNHEWNTSANNILNGNRGCSSCSRKLPQTSESISKCLIDTSRPITLIHYGSNARDRSSRWKCHDCGYEWNTSANNILNGNRGCLVCSGLAPLTSEYIEQKLIDDDRPITLIHYGSNARDRSSRWECHNCGHKWNAAASNILNSFRGCQPCSTSGFDPSKPAYFYLLKFDGFIKVGITSDVDKRHGNLNNQTINNITYTIEETIAWHFEDGKEAADLETTVLKDNKKHSYTGLKGTSFDGRTELLEHSAHQGILDYIKEHYING